MQVITGFNMGNITYDELESEINHVKQKIEKIAADSYNRLLGEEIAFLCDAVTLNILHRDGKMSIFDVAVDNINSKINNARNTNDDNPYAFSIYAHILKIDQNFILKVISGNQRFLPAFKKYESLCIDEVEMNDPNNGKTLLWEKVDKVYKDKMVLSLNLTPEDLKPDIEKVVFPEFDERVKKMARHSVLNHYMNQIAGGNQIPPFLLMPYFDKALDMFKSPAGVFMYERKQKELTQLLLELKRDSDFITKV